MTAPTPTIYTDMLPVRFDAPLLNPAPNGLFAATQWADETGPLRWLDSGVEVRSAGNYGGEDASGVWDAEWCPPPDPATVGQRKEGDRPDNLDPFAPMTVWAYDQCDLTAPSQAEVRQRAQQILRLQEQTAVEREFAARLLTEAAALPGGIETAVTLRLAVGYIEGVLAQTNTTGFIHVGAQWVATDPDLFKRNGAVLKSPGGHTVVVGGGYVDGLGDTLVATSQPYGWRDQPTLRKAIDERHNTFAAIAERSFVVGVEAVVAAVTVTP
ncbi:hypothetical protein [Mycolicibacterium elephantis]|uniref:Gp13 n=1 Tax=Mycolicibacterium elephantis DSM 44368 TaxID=1335622 RepID=A0A439DXT0_9MYCO|nr:hypothetical protein [Mycolicibacterium elephantis]MCV7223638.1 hypothetical protein [Mycolicibacterium elephantis]RWA22291.1 hypothetical protein MELE44368_13095 [Mycolicibacterium elephantis DSM 44368]